VSADEAWFSGDKVGDVPPMPARALPIAPMSPVPATGWRSGTGNLADVVDEGLAGFGERVLAVIDEGRRISTYKLAVLLALIDVCAEHPGPDGNAPVELPTTLVSRRVAELYWPQVCGY
jgi:hypothetical protein